MDKPLYIEFYAGPGSGKTTAAFNLFSEIKKEDIHVEFIREVAQERILQNKEVSPARQLSILVEGVDRAEVLISKGYKNIITDTSLDLSMYYGMGHEYEPEMRAILKKFYAKVHRVKVFVIRNKNKKYHQLGRFQTKEESMEIDNKLLDMFGPFDFTVEGKKTSSISEVFNYVMEYQKNFENIAV